MGRTYVAPLFFSCQVADYASAVQVNVLVVCISVSLSYEATCIWLPDVFPYICMPSFQAIVCYHPPLHVSLVAVYPFNNYKSEGFWEMLLRCHSGVCLPWLHRRPPELGNSTSVVSDQWLSIVFGDSQEVQYAQTSRRGWLNPPVIASLII
jgi:hypothetical protein